MKFGPVPVVQARGAVLAHAAIAGKKRFRKGLVIGDTEIEAFQAAGIETVIAAILEPGDIGEDEAARRLAAAFGNRNITARTPATGRVNLHAGQPGLFTVNAARIDLFNSIDPSITVATLANHTAVVPGQMVATVKIIPFAVGETLVTQAEKSLTGAETLAVHPFRSYRVGLVQSVLPSIKPVTLDKTKKVTEARLARLGSSLAGEIRTPHEADAIAGAIAGLLREADAVFVFGASAVCDRADVIPAAIEMAGGRVTRFGMPVDPGNLLVLGEAESKPVLGAPGCARSPKENGFDWILQRLFAGLEVSGSDIAAMGVGGLLVEIPSRPQPREAGEEAVTRPLDVEAVILAAGRSSRMGGPNKLLATFGGSPLVRMVAETALASQCGGVIAVTGHQAERVMDTLDGLDIVKVDNPSYADGLSTSLIAGIGSVSSTAAGALIMLGDMPGLSPGNIDRMIAAFRKNKGAVIVRATHNGKRGNPVLIPRVMFEDVMHLQGDTGARHLVEASELPVVDIEIGAAASLDVDTPEALEEAGGIIK